VNVTSLSGIVPVVVNPSTLEVHPAKVLQESLVGSAGAVISVQ
jgi:hypothetical protein